MTVSKHDIENLARLARIKIDEEEVGALTKDLERILAFVDELKEADAPSQEEVLVGEVRNVLRDDVELHKGGEYTEKILKNAPSREGDYIKVKNIL